MSTSTSRDALLDAVTAARAHAGGLYLGAGARGPVYAPGERGLLVLGPPRAGKTSAVVVPNVLGAPDACFVVSTKSDVLRATLSARRRRGRCFVFDPTGSLDALPGVSRIGWSPLAGAERWDDAVLIAESMVGAVHPAEHGESAHWHERATALLSCAFHAGALGGVELRRLCSYLHRREIEPISRILARGGAELALDVVTGIAETEQRELSGIWSTASGVLAAYRTEAALESARAPDLDPDGFLEGAHTIYVVASAEHQLHAAPLIAGLLRRLRTAAYARARKEAPRRANLLLVLDELAQIAPLHDLPALVAEGASQGVVTLACLQDLSQARARWGGAADGFLSLFGAKLVLGGIGDVHTLGALSSLVGDHDLPHRSTSRQRAGRALRRTHGTTRTTRRDRRLSPDAIAVPGAWRALSLVGAEPAWVQLTPYFACSPWLELAGEA